VLHSVQETGRGIAGECRCAQRGTADRRRQLIGERSAAGAVTGGGAGAGAAFGGGGRSCIVLVDVGN